VSLEECAAIFGDEDELFKGSLEDGMGSGGAVSEMESKGVAGEAPGVLTEVSEGTKGPE
jgi:hypothetical protein